MRKISNRQVATLKRNAMNVYPLIAKSNKLYAEIANLSDQLREINDIIDATETGSRIITGGINSIELISRNVVETGKFDDKGQPIKTTKWEPIADRLILNEDGTYTINYTQPDTTAYPLVTSENENVCNNSETL